MTSTHTKQSGFTLIELSIVIIIIGLVAAGFATQYKQYLSDKTLETQQENINTIREALASHAMNGFRNTDGIDLDGDGTNELNFGGAQGLKLVQKIDGNGDGDYQDAADDVRTITNYSNQAPNSVLEEYIYTTSQPNDTILSGFSLPCPAPLDINITAAGSGTPVDDGVRSPAGIPNAVLNDIDDLADANNQSAAPVITDCDANLPTGFNNGVYVINGHNGGRVIIGAVPYAALGISPQDTLDAYKNKIFYAVTGVATVAGAMDGTPPAGGIEVNNGAAAPVRTQFLLFSAGADSLGTWNAAGVQSTTPCPAAGATQRDNCLFTTGNVTTAAATFTNADQTDTNTNTHFDDTLAFTLANDNESAFFTRGAENAGGTFDIINKNPGNMVLSDSLRANQNLEAKSQLNVGTNAMVGGTGTPDTRLDVVGEAKLSMTGTNANASSQLTCDATTEGAIRYNDGTKCLEFCDSTDWQESCTPGCISNGTRVNVGDTETNTALDGCTTTTRTCQGGNEWQDSVPDRSACGCSGGYAVGESYSRTQSYESGGMASTRFTWTTTYTCQADGTFTSTCTGGTDGIRGCRP